MKCFIVFSAVLVFVAAELYSSENDDLDIEAVVKNEVLLKEFMDCFIDKGICNDQTADFKKMCKVAQRCARKNPQIILHHFPSLAQLGSGGKGGSRKDLQEAIEQACAKCTPPQKHIFKRFLEVSKVKIPSEYQAFAQKYDPENKYFKALEAAIANA